MIPKDFQIGDHVVVVEYEASDRRDFLLGHEGVVVGYDSPFYLVDHGERLMRGLSSLKGKCSPGCGWMYFPHEIQLVEEEVIAQVDDLL